MFSHFLILVMSLLPLCSGPSYPELSGENILRCPHLDPDLPTGAFTHKSQVLDITNVINENSQFGLIEDLCSSTRKIYGGWSGDITEVPFQVVLRVKYSKVLFFGNCGGSLITLKYVLTAAHCLVNSSFPLTDWRIVAGTNKGSGTEGDMHLESWRYVRCYYAHKYYMREKLRHDIAIVEAEQPFEVTDKVQPIRIHTTDLRFIIEPETRCYISGYGASDIPESEDRLRVACVPVLSFRKCSKYYPPSHIPQNTVCAGDPATGTGSCFGDSGGPLVCQGALVGVLSGGYDCAKQPGVFMRVLSYTQLESSLNSSLGENSSIPFTSRNFKRNGKKGCVKRASCSLFRIWICLIINLACNYYHLTF